MSRDRSDTITTVRRKQKISFEVLKKQEEVKNWINAVLSLSLSDDDLLNQLQDGVILCQLMNKISPGSIKVSIVKSQMPFKMMQNVSHFLKAAEKYGVKGLFLAQDLVRKENYRVVIETIHELAEIASAKGFKIPLKDFSEETNNVPQQEPEVSIIQKRRSRNSEEKENAVRRRNSSDQVTTMISTYPKKEPILPDKNNNTKKNESQPEERDRSALVRSSEMKVKRGSGHFDVRDIFSQTSNEVEKGKIANPPPIPTKPIPTMTTGNSRSKKYSVPRKMEQEETGSTKEYTESKENDDQVQPANGRELEEEDEEEDETSGDEELTLEERLAFERKRRKEARKSMLVLLSNVEKYKNVLEQEKRVVTQTTKAQLEQERLQYQKVIQKLEEENENLESTMQEYEEKLEQYEAKLEQYEETISELEEDKVRRNRETMENLQTLLKEISYIEEANEKLNSDYQNEVELHRQTSEKLCTSQSIIEQLELKIEMQNQQLEKFKSLMNESEERKRTTSIPQDLKTGNPVSEILTLRHQLEEERERIKNINSLLSQAKVLALSSPGIQQENHLENAIEAQDFIAEKKAHEETKQKFETYQHKTEKEMEELKKRIRSLLQAHNDTTTQWSHTVRELNAMKGSDSRKASLRSKDFENSDDFEFNSSVKSPPTSLQPSSNPQLYSSLKEKPKKKTSKSLKDVPISEPSNFRKITHEGISPNASIDLATLPKPSNLPDSSKSPPNSFQIPTMNFSTVMKTDEEALRELTSKISEPGTTSKVSSAVKEYESKEKKSKHGSKRKSFSWGRSKEKLNA